MFNKIILNSEVIQFSATPLLRYSTLLSKYNCEERWLVSQALHLSLCSYWLSSLKKLFIYLQNWTFALFWYWVPTILERTTSVSRWIPTFGQLLMNFLILMDLQLWQKEWEFRGCSLSSYSTTQWHSYPLVSISRCMAAACTTQDICYSWKLLRCAYLEDLCWEASNARCCFCCPPFHLFAIHWSICFTATHSLTTTWCWLSNSHEHVAMTALCRFFLTYNLMNWREKGGILHQC